MPRKPLRRREHVLRHDGERLCLAIRRVLRGSDRHPRISIAGPYRRAAIVRIGELSVNRDPERPSGSLPLEDDNHRIRRNLLRYVAFRKLAQDSESNQNQNLLMNSIVSLNQNKNFTSFGLCV
jgi:hypothetical protein